MSQNYEIFFRGGPTPSREPLPHSFLIVSPIIVLGIDTEEVDGSNPFAPTISRNSAPLPPAEPGPRLSQNVLSNISGPPKDFRG